MGRLKAMVRSALEDRSPRFMLGTIALGVVVALLAGVAIGYTLDDSGGGSGGGRKATSTKSNNNKPQGKKVKEAPLLVASVSSLNNKKVTVLDGTKQRPMGLGAKTRIYVAGDAKDSDIKKGSRVLFAPSSTSKTTATDVVVLPAKALIGQEVTAVTPGTSMSLQSLSGTEKIDTSDAVVHKTKTGRRTNLTKGTKVVVRFFVIRGRRNQATAIVVLPTDTKFN